jgi:hypothetical protein
MSSIYSRPSYRFTNQPDLRAAFWDANPGLVCRTRRGRILPQNEQPCDTRAAWVDYVDNAARNGDISEALAQRATL